MASIASLSATPKVEQAATGAKARPVMRPSIEICDAGVFWMFQTRLAETSRQGGDGQPQAFIRRRQPPLLLLDQADLAALDGALRR